MSNRKTWIVVLLLSLPAVGYGLARYGAAHCPTSAHCNCTRR